MSDNSDNSVVIINNGITRLVYFVISIATAVIGYRIHGSIFWSIVDFFFWGLAWIKWLICQEVNMTIIKDAFSFFFQ